MQLVIMVVLMRYPNTLAVHLLPDLVGAVDAQVGLPDTLDRRYRIFIALDAGAAQFRIALPGRLAPAG